MKRLVEFIAKVTRRFHPPGTERFLRMICNPDTTKGFNTIICYDHTLKLHINTKYFTEWFIFFKGYYEKPIVDLIKKHLPKGGTFVDVGANMGDMSLIAAKIGNVIAIEPVPWIARRLEQNLILNNLWNVKVEKMVASDKSGTASFYEADNGMHSGMGSLYKEHAKGREIKVQTRTLDEILGGKKVDFIKIDTEGHDRNVIMGAKEIITKYKPVIIFEEGDDTDVLTNISKKDIELFLKSLGYTQTKIDSSNVLCLPI